MSEKSNFELILETLEENGPQKTEALRHRLEQICERKIGRNELDLHLRELVQAKLVSKTAKGNGWLYASTPS